MQVHPVKVPIHGPISPDYSRSEGWRWVGLGIREWSFFRDGFRDQGVELGRFRDQGVELGRFKYM